MSPGDLASEITAFAAIAVPMTGAIVFIFSLMADRKNAALSDDLMAKINGTYLRAKEAQLKFDLIDERFRRGEKVFEQIDRHFDFLRDERRHDQAQAGAAGD